MRGLRSRGGFGRKRTARKTWLTSVLQGGQLTVPAGPSISFTTVLDNSTIDAEFGEPTLLRTRFNLSYGEAGGGNVNAVAGLMARKGVIVGATVTSRPIGDGDADWVFWQPIQIITGLAGGGHGVNNGVGSFEVDVRSMRKMDKSSDLVLVVEATTGSSAFTFNFAGRFLFLDP